MPETMMVRMCLNFGRIKTSFNSVGIVFPVAILSCLVDSLPTLETKLLNLSQNSITAALDHISCLVRLTITSWEFSAEYQWSVDTRKIC